MRFGKRIAREKGRCWSAALCAVLVYCVINCIVENTCQHLVSVNSWSLQMLSAVDQLNNSYQAPKIVLVGSSFMRYPIWHVDRKHSLSASHASFKTYHSAKWFEQELAKAGENDVGVFSLAMDGAITSDVYLICDKLLKGSRRPNLIIYGIAERDIVMGLFHGERNTPAFKLLFEPEDCQRLGYLFTTNLQERIALELAERLPIYGDRQVLQERAVQLGSCVEPYWSAIFGLGSLSFVPPRSYLKAGCLTDRNDEFITRFGPSWAMSRRLLENQKTCLNLLSSLAEKRGCFLLLVNMPTASRRPQKTTSYDEYVHLLHSCARAPNTFLLDLADQDSTFSQECFLKDGGHMNAVGGEKLIVRLTEWIKEHRKILASS